MNETFRIPNSESNISEAPGSDWDNFMDDNKTESTSDAPTESWDRISEDFSDDDFLRQTQEIASRNTYDKINISSEKSEAEKSYESKERSILSELEAISYNRAKHIEIIGDEYGKTLRKFEDPRAKSILDSFNNLSRVTKKSDRSSFSPSSEKITSRDSSLDALVQLVNLKYPSPYRSENSRPLNPFEDRTDEYQRAQDNFLLTARANSEEKAKILENLSKTINLGGSQSDLYIGTTLKNLGNGTVDTEKSFSSAIINYLDDPTDNNKRKLRNVESDHENLLSNSLFNIAGSLDESKNVLNQKLFEPTIALTTNLVRTDEDYFDGILKYLQFKIDNARPFEDSTSPEISETQSPQKRSSYEEALASFDVPNKSLPNEVIF